MHNEPVIGNLEVYGLEEGLPKAGQVDGLSSSTGVDNEAGNI